MRRILIAAAVAAYHLSAAADGLDVKGLTLGSDLQAEATANNMQCRLEGEETRCTPRIPISLGERLRTIGGKTVLVAILSGFDGKLGHAFWQVREGDFDDLKEAMAAKYPGLKCTESSVPNRAGAAFQQTECEYRSGAETLTLQRRAGRVDRSMVELTSSEYTARAAAARSAKAKGAAKSDL